MSQPGLFVKSGAHFDGAYRYRLWRIWNDVEMPRLVTWVMLNPSTADAVDSDPTVERCIRRSRSWGYDGLEVVNIFALISTDPDALYDHPSPVGIWNDQHIIEAAERSSLVLCAWGKHGALDDRGDKVKGMIAGVAQRQPHCLKINGDGSPAHPLYLSYDLKPIPFR